MDNEEYNLTNEQTSSDDENDGSLRTLAMNRRIAAKSRVNFSKLLDHDKELRFRNMAKKIKRLKAQNRALKKRYKLFISL